MNMEINSQVHLKDHIELEILCCYPNNVTRFLTQENIFAP